MAYCSLLYGQTEVTYLYISGIVTIPKQSECNVNSYNKDTVAFCKCENAVSWLDKTANITRLRHINLHKCWLLAGFLFGNMILWVGIWLEPIWVSRTWLSTNDQPSPLSTFSFSYWGSIWKAKLGQADTGTLLLLLLIPVSVCSASSSRIPEESTSLGLRGRRVQKWQKTGH